MENESGKEKGTDDSTPHRRRKAGLKFAPKVSLKKTPQTIPKTEPHEEDKVAAIDKELIIRLRSSQSTDSFRSRAKAEKQETGVQVAFGRTDPSVPRIFTTPRNNSSDVSAVKVPKKHNEPWGRTCTNYPVTLPLRRPYSVDPDILDEGQFRESSSRTQDVESTAAGELGLMDRVDQPQLLFFQFPSSLPLPRQADPVEADIDTNVDVDAKVKGNSRKRLHPIHGCNLKELPGGHMGKILVYKSGKVKMTVGDVLFDVSAGSNCSFAQEAVAVDTREKCCCSIGEVGKRAIVTPDIDYLRDCIKME